MCWYSLYLAYFVVMLSGLGQQWWMKRGWLCWRYTQCRLWTALWISPSTPKSRSSCWTRVQEAGVVNLCPLWSCRPPWIAQLVIKRTTLPRHSVNVSLISPPPHVTANLKRGFNKLTDWTSTASRTRTLARGFVPWHANHTKEVIKMLINLANEITGTVI